MKSSVKSNRSAKSAPAKPKSVKSVKSTFTKMAAMAGSPRMKPTKTVLPTEEEMKIPRYCVVEVSVLPIKWKQKIREFLRASEGLRRFKGNMEQTKAINKFIRDNQTEFSKDLSELNNPTIDIAVISQIRTNTYGLTLSKTDVQATVLPSQDVGNIS